MADTTLSFNVLAQDNASRTIGRVGQSFGNLHLSVGKVMKGLVAVGPALAGLAVGAGIKQFIEDARESAKVGRLTAQVIKSTGGAAKITADQVGDLATAISNKTGADDEAIQSGQNLLLTFTNIKNGVGKGNDIFNQASQAITDMTAALNDGEVTADGMKTSSIQLGKALNDPIKGVTALQKVGVSFTEDQKKQIKTLVDSGKTMEAQKIILNELGKEFGGAAEAAADPLTKLKTIAGNASEAIGGLLLPVVDKAATWLGKILPIAVEKGGAFFKKNLLPPLQTVTSFIQDRVIPGFVGLYNLLVKHDFSKEFRKAFHVEEDSGIVAFLLSINEGVKTAAGNAKLWAGQIIGGLTAGFQSSNWKPLGAALGNGVIAGVKGIGTVSGKLLDSLGALIDKVDWGQLGTRIGDGFRDILKSVDWKGLGESVGDTLSSIFQKSATLSDKVGKAFKSLMDKVDWKKIGRDSTDAIGKFIEGVDWVKVSKTLGLAVLKSLKLSHDIIDQTLGSVAALVGGIAEEIGKAIGKWFAGAGRWLWQKGKDLVSGLMSGAGDQAGGIGSWLSQHVVAPVVDAFKTAGKWLVRHGGDLITGLKNGITDAAKGIGNWIMRAPVAQVILPFLGAVKWLIGPGRNVIAGLLSGISSSAKSIGAWLGRNVIGPTVGAFSKAGSWLVQQGKNLVAGFENGVSALGRGIGGWLGRNVVNPVVGAFTRAGTWLVQHGRNLIAGLQNGAAAIAGSIGSWMYNHVAVPVVSAFGKAGAWLSRAGRDLIGGLTGGVAARMKGIGSWIKSTIIDPIVSGVKTFFGIKSPSKVFAGIGGNLIAGLFKGMGSGVGTAVAKKVFGDMPSALRSIVGKGLISVSNLPKKALDALGMAVGGPFMGGGDPAPTNLSGMQALFRTVAAQHGWGSGSAWNSLYNLEMGEAGFNPNAQNPTSTAYGFGQFLNSTWATVGGSKTSNPWLQAEYMMRYISRNYGSPENAYSKWSSRSPHWYEKGTPWVPNDQLAFVHEGEGILPRKVNEARIAAGRNGGAQTVVLEFRSDGSPHMDWLVTQVKKYVRVSGGGSVQQAFGTNR